MPINHSLSHVPPHVVFLLRLQRIPRNGISLIKNTQSFPFLALLQKNVTNARILNQGRIIHALNF